MSSSQAPTVPPFPAFPAVGRYVELGSTDDAMSRLFRAIDAREALSTVIGPPGVGKSLLCDLLAEGHRDSHEVVVLNQAPVESKQSLIKHLLHGLGVKPDADSDLHLQLVDRVSSRIARGGLLVIVDEAQTLCDEVLEAIRMVTNITALGQRRVMAVLAGNSKMDDRMADPSMESFVQRVATRCYLHPLDEGQTRSYLHKTIESCGSDPTQTIDDAACDAIHLASGGVPRLINHLMTEAIDCAAKADEGLIDADMVNLAWANLQQLPSPMVDERKLSPVMETLPVEFGSLGDCDDSDDCFTEPELELPPEPVIPPAPTAEELFGDFSDEQAIDVGVAPEIRMPRAIGHSLELEEQLHQEVVSMTDETQRETRRETQPKTEPGDNMYADLACFEPLPVEDVDNDNASRTEYEAATNCDNAGGECDDSSAIESGSIQDVEFGSLQAVDGHEGLRLSPETSADELDFEPEANDEDDGEDSLRLRSMADDQDILIVEDTIEMIVEPSDAVPTDAFATETIVDFQAMMSRMRAGA